MSKVSSAGVESLNLSLREPFKVALRARYNAPNVVVFVETKTDVANPGEGPPDRCITDETQGATLDTVSKASELLASRDAVNCRAIIEDLHATFPSAVSSLLALETAIIDVYCREINIPTAGLFDGSLDVAEVDMTIPIHTPDVAAERAESVVQSGFETLKIKVGEDLETDIRRVRSASEAAPNATTTVDANQGRSVSGAITLDQAIHDVEISLPFLKQPVVKPDIAGLVSVRNRTRVPVGVDEAVSTPENTVRVIRNDAADIVDIKLGKSGLLGAVDIVVITWAAERDLIVDCMSGNSIGIHISTRLVSGIGGFSHVDLDTTRLLDSDVIDRESGPTITPSGPGHGVIPNW